MRYKGAHTIAYSTSPTAESTVSVIRNKAGRPLDAIASRGLPALCVDTSNYSSTTILRVALNSPLSSV